MRRTLGQSRSAGRWATWGLVALSLMITAEAGATTITETGTITSDTIQGFSGNNLGLKSCWRPIHAYDEFRSFGRRPPSWLHHDCLQLFWIGFDGLYGSRL